MRIVNKVKDSLYFFSRRTRKSIDGLAHGRCAVLLYHRVSNYITDPQQLCVTPENFDRQLEYLKLNAEVLEIGEWTAALIAGEKLPSRSVVITFDDGYADNHDFALPIMMKHRLQGLFYVTTGIIGSDSEFWWDDVERILLLSRPLSDRIFLKIKGEDFSCGVMIDERQQLYDRLLPALRTMNFEDRSKSITELAVQFALVDLRHSHRPMTWDEVRAMNVSPSVVLGAHTVNHVSLAAQDRKTQYDEIAISKKKLEEETAVHISHFSYPFGTINDFNNDTKEICMELGFHIACANIPYISNRRSDLFAVPRFLVRDWNVERFASELNNFFSG